MFYCGMLVRGAIEERRRNGPGHVVMFALVSLAAAVLVGCGSDDGTKGPGGSDPNAASIRYRAPVFTDVSITRDIQYQSTPPLALDLYEPSGDHAAKRPVVIWMHGGGFADGNKSEGPMIGFPTAFAKLGYVAVSIDYRLLAPQQCIDPLLDSQVCTDAAAAATADAQAAARFLRANAATYRIDPDRVAVAGESAGAIAATEVGLHADDEADGVQAWISISGGAGGGGVDSGDAPGLLFANTVDPLVPFERSRATAAAMQAAGVPVVLRQLDGTGHVDVIHYGQVFIDESRDFLYEHLDLASADQ